MTSRTASAILHRAMTPTIDGLEPVAAKAILGIKFGRRDVKRINDLSALARRGELTKDQADELDFYLNFGSVLTILHSKARLALRQRAAAPRPSRRKTA
jgi:hypothetical protein